MRDKIIALIEGYGGLSRAAVLALIADNVTQHMVDLEIEDMLTEGVLTYVGGELHVA